MTAEIPAGQVRGEFAVAMVKQHKVRWDEARSLTVFHDAPPLLGPYPRPGADRVNATDVLVHLLMAPGCPSLEDCDGADISRTALPVPQVEFRVHSRAALQLWGDHFGMTDGHEFPMSSGRLYASRWVEKDVAGRRVRLVVTGTLEKAS